MFTGFWVVLNLLAMLVHMGPASGSADLRNFMYLTGQHPVMPVHMAEQQDITHMALAFMPSGVFNRRGQHDVDGNPHEWPPLFQSINHTRMLVNPKTKLLVAIGGWGDTFGFEKGAQSPKSRQRFAHNVAAMVTATGADGVDIDWEYPGGNGEDYREVPNAEKAWEITAYPLLLAAIREALGPDKILSAAVPGKPEDMLAFTPDTVPDIMRSVDFLNVMTYDLMNRRNTVTTHHSGVQNSLTAVDAYIAAGCDARRINFGLAFYVKYYKTEHDDCVRRKNQTGSALGCRTLLMEDPDTGADLGRAAAFSWHDNVPEEVQASFARAQTDGTYDKEGGGYYYWDEDADLWWSFDTAEAIASEKIPRVLQARKLGGVFAWGLGEDGPKYEHFTSMCRAWKKVRDDGWGMAGRNNSSEIRDEL
ncbi:hypothetical protein SCUCBS95973_008502 [Sporothrix curviconia]|uniref:chitinase n=1 Tax=Sporothrix curviconia TaxID=1260050 RepID=A0ABP0CPY9_9PEZI